MANRSTFQEGVRAVLLVAVVLIGTVVPSAAVAVPAVLGATLAYDGSARRPLAWTGLFLVVTELCFALDLGILVIPYLVGAGALVVVGRLLSVPSWVGGEGWAMGDVLRATVVACGVAVTMMVVAALVEALYGHGLFVRRLSQEVLTIRHLWPVVPLCAAVLVVLRRIDIPFRRPLTFGV